MRNRVMGLSSRSTSSSLPASGDSASSVTERGLREASSAARAHAAIATPASSAATRPRREMSIRDPAIDPGTRLDYARHKRNDRLSAAVSTNAAKKRLFGAGGGGSGLGLGMRGEVFLDARLLAFEAAQVVQLA